MGSEPDMYDRFELSANIYMKYSFFANIGLQCTYLIGRNTFLVKKPVSVHLFIYVVAKKMEKVSKLTSPYNSR